MNLETKITIYKFTPQLFTLTHENDNFRNKLWVLTSYDASRKEEDKLRKVVSEETAFKKEVNSSSPLQYSLEKGVTLSTFSPDSLSQPKDTTNINIEQ